LNSPSSKKNPAQLFIVATPLGNLEDMSFRAVRILQEVDVIAAEDTRRVRPLLVHYGVATQVVSCHVQNEQHMAEKLLQRMRQGQSIALVSDAGTPLISDPGFPLVVLVRAQGFEVIPIPGPCALIAALSVAGLPVERFVFEGFLPSRSAARKSRLQELISETRTVVFYESCHRIVSSLEDMTAILGSDREAVVARELTKRFETIIKADLDTLVATVRDSAIQQKGEFVVLVKGAEHVQSMDQQRLATMMDRLCVHMPRKKAAEILAEWSGEKKNRLYGLGLD